MLFSIGGEENRGGGTYSRGCVVWGKATSTRTVPLGDGGSRLGRIGGGAPESWRSANFYLAILSSKVNDLLDFSVSDA